MVQVSQILRGTPIPPLFIVRGGVLFMWRSLFTPHQTNKCLRYPGPTLKALDLVQQEQFRKDILRPDVVENLTNAWMSTFTAPKE